MTFSRADLFDIVETYASFGDHHTGTDADHATTDWLVALLGELGASVDREPFDFERFDGSVRLESSGAEVPVLPLYYAALGECITTEVEVVRLDASGVGNARRLLPDLPSPDGTGAIAIAFDGPDDLPVQCNRVPGRRYERPAVVIPGNWADRVERDARLTYRASLASGSSANVLARLGDPVRPRVSITTPLTGWTPAAGERGTGLAAAIAMAVELSDDHCVDFSACAGHELDHLGLHHHLARRDVAGVPVIHLGASVAATEADSAAPARLGTSRFCLCSVTGTVRGEIERRAADAAWTVVDLDPWVGEGGTWRDAGASVLSFVGGSTVFHTAADVITGVEHPATTPDAVERATEVAIDCARRFLAAHR